MGREVITTGQVNVWRGDIDADELRAIRGGAWSYDRLIEETEAEFDALQRIPRSAWAVPDTVDREAIDQLVHELLASHVGIAPVS